MNLARATARDPEEKGQGEHTGARAAVVDSGYFVCRAGFAGDACPRVDVPPYSNLCTSERMRCVQYGGSPRETGVANSEGRSLVKNQKGFFVYVSLYLYLIHA